ncbi:MAG: hypothetical protein R6T78_05055 [Dehalococcoidales bacterium]
MKEKRFVTITIALPILVAILAFPVAACTGEVNFSGSSLSNATMCNSVDASTREPIEPTNVFSPDTPEIYCSVKLSNIPTSSEISAHWIYVQGELENLSNFLIDETSITTSGTRYLSFSETKPENGWPTGDYQVKLYLDGEEKTSATFKVE